MAARVTLNITALPIDFLDQVFQHFSHKEIVLMMRVSKQFQAASLLAQRTCSEVSLYRGNEHINDESFTIIVDRCDAFRTLNIDYCNKITSIGLANLGRCPHLERLHADCSDFTDEHLEIIGECCPKLMFICLESCWQITITGIEEILTRCTMLRQIDLGDTSLDNYSLNQLRDEYPDHTITWDIENLDVLSHSDGNYY